MRPALTVRQVMLAVIAAVSIFTVVVFIEQFSASGLLGSGEFSEKESAELRDLLQSGAIASDTTVEIRDCRIHVTRENMRNCSDSDCELRKEQIINLKNVEISTRTTMFESEKTDSPYPVNAFRFPHEDENREWHLRVSTEYRKMIDKLHENINDYK